MATYVVFFSNAGAPATGLTPVFTTLTDLVPAAVAAPTVTEIGGGFYTFTLVPATDLVAVIDGGVALPAADRYLHAMLTPRDSSPALISKDAVPMGAAFADLDGGNGIRQVTITIDDGTDPVPTAIVSVFVVDTNTYVAEAVASSLGVAVFALQDGTYDIRVLKPGYTFTTPTEIVVTATAGFTISGTAAAPAAPVDPLLCRLYMDAINLDGTDRVNTRVTVENLYENPVQSNVIVDSGQVFTSGSASNRVQFDLPRGGKFRISVQDTPISKEITVPAASTADLATLLGSPVDSFTVVTAS